jgi:hypothetical protein
MVINLYILFLTIITKVCVWARDAFVRFINNTRLEISFVFSTYIVGWKKTIEICTRVYITDIKFARLISLSITFFNEYYTFVSVFIALPKVLQRCKEKIYRVLVTACIKQSFYKLKAFVSMKSIQGSLFYISFCITL